MVTCLTEVFIWSLKNNISIPGHVIGCHSYHDKGESGGNHQYNEEKQQFIESRDMIWAPRNKRPEKLRDSIKEMEDLLSQHKVIQCRWRSRKVIQIVLSNASVITYVLLNHSGDIERVLIDKTLVGKLSGDVLTDAHLTDQFMVAAYSDKSKVDYIYFVKRPPLGEAIKRIEKLSAWEPKVVQIDIPGPVGRRLDRSLSCNIHHDMVLLWWPYSSDEAMPWSPMATEKDRANLIILSVHGPNVDVLTYTKTECDPVFAQFRKTESELLGHQVRLFYTSSIVIGIFGQLSNLQPHKVYTVEQAMSSGGDRTAKTCTYEVVQGKIQRTSVINMALKSVVCSQSRSPGEDKLLLGCVDGTVILMTVMIRGSNLLLHKVIYDELRKVTQMIRAAVMPTVIAWHPTGTVFFVGGKQGDLQVFDMSLSPLKVQLLAEEPSPHRTLQISKYFRTPPALREMHWCPFDPQAADWTGDYTDALFMIFERGPAAVLMLPLGVVSRERFSCVELIKEYIRQRQLDEAVSLLGSMNWDIDGQSCYTCLSAIVNHLLKMPLNSDREAQLEDALGTFYNPKRALSEVTIMDYRDPISRLARRFFHHLLRYARFDKAFLLAVDIGARDLFMDIHYMALDKGETALAEVARRKAEAIDNDSIDSMDGFDDDVPGLDNNFYQQNGSAGRAVTNERIPASRQHPWQQGQSSPSLSTNSSRQSPIENPGPPPDRGRQLRRGHQPQNEDLHLELGELDIDDDFISDYTSPLKDGPGWPIQENILQDGDETSVKVIHFGVV